MRGMLMGSSHRPRRRECECRCRCLYDGLLLWWVSIAVGFCHVRGRWWCVFVRGVVGIGCGWCFFLLWFGLLWDLRYFSRFVVFMVSSDLWGSSGGVWDLVLVVEVYFIC